MIFPIKANCNHRSKKTDRFWVVGLVFCCISMFHPNVSKAQSLGSENYQLGNVNFGQQLFFTTSEYAAPVILGSGPEVVELTPFSAKIRWLTDKNSFSTVFYGVESGAYSQEVSKAYEGTTSHEIELLNLNPKTTYYFTALSKDYNGNSGQSEEKIFTTPLPVPEISAIEVRNITKNMAEIYFTTNYYTSSIIEYVDLETLAKKTIAESSFSKQHQLIIDNLSDDTDYSCIIIARDDEGHESVSSSFVFHTQKDSDPPIIDDIQFDINLVTGKNKVRATIAWKTDEESTSMVAYKESNTDQYQESQELEDNVKNHFITLTDLKPQTTYKVIAISKDVAGNLGKSEEYVILTPKQKRTFLQIILENIQQIFEPFARLFGSE